MRDTRGSRGIVALLERFRLQAFGRRWVFVLAAVGFAVGFALSLASVDLQLTSIKWWVVVAVVVVGVPLMTLANAAEYKVAGAIIGRTISSSSAVRVAVLSTAANLLPLPGGPLVKAKGLVDEGARPPRAVLVTVLMAAAWLAVAVIVAGLFGGLERDASVVLALIGSLLGLGVVTVLNARVLESRNARIIGAVGVVEIAATLATGLRIWLVGQALGLDIGPGALVLGIAPVLGAAVVFVPAGLGVRELLSSLAAPAIGLSPAMGFLISAIDRLAGLLVHGTAAVFIAVSSGRGSSLKEMG